MKGICPCCEKETDIQLIKNEQTISVRGEDIEVVEQYFKCTACGETFENTRAHDALDMAYREYHRRHGMVQPDEIRDWRKTYGLT
jgi:transposase-like protein